MRIVLPITMGIERPSGVRYFQIARGLARRGHSVRILALHPDLAGCPQRRFVRDGVEVWYVGQMHARKSGSVPVRFNALQLLRVLIGSTLGMIWGMLCSPADVYHLGKPQPVNGLAALVAVLLRGRRFYVDCDDDEVGSNRFSAGWQRAVFAFWQSLLPRLAAGVTVNTRFLAERMRRRGIERVVYVPNGVDLDRLRRPDPAASAGLRAALGLAGRRVIAYAGTLALHNHPVDLLLDAFAQLAPDLPDLDLLLIGGGEDLPELRRRVRAMGLTDRVHFTGQLPQQSVRGYLSLAALSVDPVHDDDVARARSPLKIFESMALGVPVVTGDVGDRRQLLAHGAGVVTAPGDATALATTIRRLLDDPAWLRAAASAATAAAAQYDWHRLSGRWTEVYAPSRPDSDLSMKESDKV
ncbi:MAG TPA: glycosyltransferase family 4 protein [Herpetosiphonaceae bacterium]